MLFPFSNADLSKCKYTSPFGPRWGRMHRGIDISVPVNTRIHTPLDGVVHASKVNGGGPTKGYGYYIIIHHPAQNIYTLYAHLNKLSTLKPGDKVQAGDFIAHSGNTGTSTGPHLHFEIHEKVFKFSSQVGNGTDSAVDPVKYYPNLAGFLNQNLGKYTQKTFGGDIVEFKHDWQKKQFIEAIRSLGKKGKLSNAEDWIKKFEEGKLTNSEVGLMSISLIDRLS